MLYRLLSLAAGRVKEEILVMSRDDIAGFYAKIEELNKNCLKNEKIVYSL